LITEPQIAAVILAAGGSTRFGQPKQLLPWEGRPLVAHVADTAWAAGLTPTVVVLGAAADEIAPALAGRPVQRLFNYRWEAGLSTSLSVGIAALPPEVAAAVFLQVDQPLLTPQFLRGLISRWQQTSAGIVVPAWEGRRGSPVLFSREFFPALAQLSGDVGGRALLGQYAARVATFPVADPDLLADVDTPAEYERLLALARAHDPARQLAEIRAVICDMDGVLWRGSAPLPGLHEFFAWLEERGIAYQLVTNNASRTPADYIAKLAALGVETTPEHVLNSALAAAAYLAETVGTDVTVYPLGGPGVAAALRQRGFRIAEGQPADYVVVGWNPKVDWGDFAAATRFILAGAGFIGTNPDPTFPTEDGLVPGNGAQLALLETATGVAPTIVGKPEPPLYRQALARMDADPATTLVIGDRLGTDILGGLRLGMPTALLLSGVTSPAQLAASPIHPTLVVDDLAALVRSWQEVLA